MFYYIKLIYIYGDHIHIKNHITRNTHNMKNIIHTFSNIPMSIQFSVGCNSRENTHLIDLAKHTDLWFHAQDHPSCHVIAYVPNIKLTKKQTMTIVKMGCMLCKQHTNKLKHEKKIEFSYTQIKNITKSETEGTVFTSNLKTYTI